MQYANEYLTEISFPLGGIGSGCIGLAGNGRLVDWEIFNRPNKNTENGWSHFAVRCMDGNNVIDARVLVSDDLSTLNGRGDKYGHGANFYSMNGFPHFLTNTFDGEFPVAQLGFADERFPGTINLRAFNPIIPLDSKNSSLPAAFFEVEFQNTADKELTFEAVLSVANPFRNSKNATEGKTLTLLDATDEKKNVSVATDCTDAYVTEYWYRGWLWNGYKDNIRTFWNGWSKGEPLHQRHYENADFYDTGSVSGAVTLQPKETKAVRFVITWSIPDNCNYWHPLEDESGNNLTWKNYYATLFDTSRDSAAYCLANWDMLYSKTEAFRKAVYDATIPESFKQAIGSGLSVLKSPTVTRLEDGSLYGFEGSHYNRGSCEGLCKHVWNYAYVCCYLFPDLEQGIRDNEFQYGVLETGETVFRLPLPFDRKWFVNMFTGDGTKFFPAVDAQMGDVIKSYRQWKLSADDAWLRRHWDTIKKVLDFATSPENEQQWDLNADGILEGSQHHTLDVDMFGPSGWLQGFYLGALQCAAEMAEHLSDREAYEKYIKLFKNGYRYTKEQLFNGNYFIQNVDLKDKTPVDKFHCDPLIWNAEHGEVCYQISEGCFIDQLCGQWHSILCGFQKPFDDAQAKTAVLNIFKNNYRSSMRDFLNPWRLFALNDEGGTLMCTYPEGCRTPATPIAYAEEVMTGFEYAFAGILVHYGFTQEAKQVVDAVRDRYNGKKRNPYNDTECGSNYVRSMAAFSLLPIMSGFVADLPNATLTFDPKGTLPFRGAWFVATGWGTFSADDNVFTLQINDGSVVLEKLVLPFIKEARAVLLDGKEISDYRFDGKALQFPKTVITKSICVRY